MPLSKKRNRDRMRIARATYVQPEDVQPTRVIPGFRMAGVVGVKTTKRKRRDEMTADELGIVGHDADGYPVYE